MGDFFQNECEEKIRILNDHMGILAGRRMIEGVATLLGDVKLSDAIQFLKQTNLYTSGQYKDIDTSKFAVVFERAGFQLDKSLSENSALLGRLHLGKSDFFNSKPLEFLKPAFKTAENASSDPKSLSDAAQLLTHIVDIVSESPSCHQDFDDTKWQSIPPEHIRFLSLG